MLAAPDSPVFLNCRDNKSGVFSAREDRLSQWFAAKKLNPYGQQSLRQNRVSLEDYFLLGRILTLTRAFTFLW